jgi:3,4-dihydroxy 2-butanone 4-phosphate synthase/GTP cyclohydrolase II
MVELSRVKLETAFGIFDEILFSDGNKNVYVLIKGNIKNKEKVLCRIHSHCVTGHYFFSVGCDCSKQMVFSQKLIETEGQGIIMWLEQQEGRGNGHYAKMQSEAFKKEGYTQTDAYLKAGYPSDTRNYFEVKSILNTLGIKSIVLISSSNTKTAELKKLDINISSTIDLNKCIINN